MMPEQTQAAVTWALQQTYTDFDGEQKTITQDDAQPLVDSIRQYFNTNNIKYDNFSYSDIRPYLQV